MINKPHNVGIVAEIIAKTVNRTDFYESLNQQNCLNLWDLFILQKYSSQY